MDKCVCHLNGYAIKDAQSRQKIAELEGKATELVEVDTALRNDVDKLLSGDTNLDGRITEIETDVANNTSKLGTLETQVEDATTSVQNFATQLTTFESSIKSAIYETAFPIGKIEVFFDDADHSNYMGFTWERFAQGRTLIGMEESHSDYGTIGNTIGEETHTLTIEEMPMHKHEIYQHVNGYNLPVVTDYSNGGGQQVAQLAHSSKISSLSSGAGDVQGLVNAYYAGNSKPHNNIQPSIIVAYWKRVK